MLDTLKNPEGKFSGRKITALAFTIFAGRLNWNPSPENQPIILGIDCFVIVVCLGLVTIPELLKFFAEIKNKKLADN